MIIGVSLGSFHGLSLPEARDLCLKAAGELDLRAVELRFGEEPDRPSRRTYDDDIRDFLARFPVTGAHLPFLDLNPVSSNPGIRDESLRQLEDAISRAAGLGMSYAVMHAAGRVQGADHEEELARWREVIARLARYAGEQGILLALENADALADLKDLADMVRSIGSPDLKIILDTGHAAIRYLPPLGTYPVRAFLLRALDAAGLPFFLRRGMPYERYGSVRSFLDAEYDLIAGLHMHDYNGRRDHLGLGQGKLDFSFLPELERREFPFPVIIEAKLTSHYSDLRDNVRRVRQMAAGGRS